MLEKGAFEGCYAWYEIVDDDPPSSDELGCLNSES
jgi:hypothetical protein